MGTPLLVLSGGDPVNRPDLLDLIRHGKSRGLRMATIPAATDCLTRELVQSLKDAGPRPDGGEPRLSPRRAARRVPRRPGLVREDHAGGRVGPRGGSARCRSTPPSAATPPPTSRRWPSSSRGSASSSGRCSSSCPWAAGRSSPALSASECERLFEVIYGLQKKGDFIVKVTEAPHYRRHVAQREMKDAGLSARPDGLAAMPERLTQSEGPGHTVGLAPRGVNSGNGFLFISHLGEIFPSGFLPIKVGNVREMSLAHAYRETAALPEPAHARAAQGPLRPLRVPRHLRRLALARLRPDRGPLRDRPLVLLRAPGIGADPAQAAGLVKLEVGDDRQVVAGHPREGEPAAPRPSSRIGPR